MSAGATTLTRASWFAYVHHVCTCGVHGRGREYPLTMQAEVQACPANALKMPGRLRHEKIVISNEDKIRLAEFAASLERE